MNTYEVQITYTGHITLEATNEQDALDQAKEIFGDETGSWEMAKCAGYEVRLA